MMLKVFDGDELIYSYETEWQRLMSECVFPARERIDEIEKALMEARHFLIGPPVLVDFTRAQASK